MKYRNLKLLLLTMTLLFLLIGCSYRNIFPQNEIINDTPEENETKESKQEDSNGVESFKVNNMDISVNYGLNGYAKYGEHFRIHAKLTNHGEGYNGFFQISIPGGNNENAVYQQVIRVGTEETQDVEFVIPMNGIGDQFHYKFTGKGNETVVENTAVVKLLYDQDIAFFGILSNGHTEFKYLEDNKIKRYYLDEDNIPNDYLGLESLDAIIIHDYDLTLLTQAQHNSLLQWVSDGGSLILDNISGKDIFLKELQENKGIKTTYITKYDIEFGNIQLANIDLNISHDKVQTVGVKILDEIIHNLGEMKQLHNGNRNGGGYYNYNIYDTLSIPDAKEIPEVGGYIIVLLIYIIIVGPILYIILRKKDRSQLTWILVPMIAILFTIIVYSLGLNTRVTKPYAKYLTYARIGRDGMVLEDTYFSLTSPLNQEYNISFDEKHPIGIITNQQFYMSNSQLNNHDYSEYTRVVSQEENKTTLRIKDFPSFTPSYFTGKSKTTNGGSYEYYITDDIDQVNGKFTNNLGFELTNSVIMCNSTLIPVGNIEDGKTVDIDNSSGVSYSSPNSIYYTDVLEKMIGGNLKSRDTGALRMRKALEIYIEDSMMNMTMDNYLIGFSGQKETRGIMDSLNLESQGIKVIVIPLNVINKSEDGEDVLSSIDPYITDSDGYTLDVYRYMPNDVIDVKYTFEEDDKINSIHYNKRGNLEFNNESEVGFFGTIYFYNHKKKDYDGVFWSGKAGSITDLSPYLDEGNNLLVKYMAENEKLRNTANMIPVLSAKKEAY